MAELIEAELPVIGAHSRRTLATCKHKLKREKQQGRVRSSWPKRIDRQMGVSFLGDPKVCFCCFPSKRVPSKNTNIMGLLQISHSKLVVIVRPRVYNEGRGMAVLE